MTRDHDTRQPVPPKSPEQTRARTLRPIDPADFKHIGGGAPRGGWAAIPTPESAETFDAPRGGW